MPTPAPVQSRDAARASLAAVAAANAAGVGLYCRSEWCGSDDQRLHVVCAGNGPAVVFIHGFPALWSCWVRQMAALNNRFAVSAIDAPGAGASCRSSAPADYRVDRLMAALDGAIDHLAGGRRVVLVGHDWGAALAFAYAQTQPGRLAGVVGMSAPPVNLFLDLLTDDPGQQARSGYMQHLRTLDAQGAADLAPGLADRAYAGLVERGLLDAAELDRIAAAIEDPAALLAGAAWYRANVPMPGGTAPRWPADDTAITIPAMLIWGDADQAFVPGFPDRFAAHHHGSQVLRLPGVGHWPMFEASAAVNVALTTFLGRDDVTARYQDGYA